MATATVPINVVIDLSHHNEKVDFKKIAADGIVGVIHKATQGRCRGRKIPLETPAGSRRRAFVGSLPFRDKR